MSKHSEEISALYNMPMSDAKPPAKPSQRTAGQLKQAPGVSGYKGVVQDKSSGRWRAKIKANGVVRHLGIYDTAEEAAVAYNWAARELYGEGAILNNVLMGDRPPVRRTKSEAHQRTRIRSAAGYKGVVQDKTSGRWRAKIKANGVEHRLGTYNTAEEAAAAYNWAARELYGEGVALNDVQMGQQPPARRILSEIHQHKPTRSVSGYKGVVQDKSSGAWQAKIKANGVLRFLGLYDTAEEAAAAYNWAARELYGEGASLNDVPMDDRPPVRRTQSLSQQRRRARDSYISGYKGVYQDRSSGRWRAQISVKGAKRYLGMYTTAEEAAAAYNRAAKEFFGEGAWLNDVP